MPFLYFTTEYAIKTHDKIIQNDIYYPDLENKINHLVFSINKNHAFTDGNRRTSIALGAFFLELNGFDNMVSKFIIEMENIAVLVADNRIGKDLFFKIITSLIYEEEYSEELKLKIIEVINYE